MTGDRTSPKHIRLFRSSLLERLTLFPPEAFFAVWSVTLPLIAWAGWVSTAHDGPGLLQAICLIAGGFAVWVLFEYSMHRFLFHCRLDVAPVRWLVFLLHGNHHADPNDRMRNLMPPVVSMPIAALVWWCSVRALGLEGTWLFLGFISGYVGYDVIHYACHQWPMRSRLGQAFKRHHMRHHYVDEDRNFAITAIFLDRLVGSRVESLRD